MIFEGVAFVDRAGMVTGRGAASAEECYSYLRHGVELYRLGSGMVREVFSF